MKVQAVQCPTCLDVIFSRAHYDYHACSCGEVNIDGGRDYFKVGYGKVIPMRVILKFAETDKITESVFYNDWNNRKDKYGLITTSVIFKDGEQAEYNYKSKTFSIIKKAKK